MASHAPNTHDGVHSMTKSFTAAVATALLMTIGSGTPTLAMANDEPTTWFEIFKLAPGKQEPFIRMVALEDEVLKAGGQPPIKLFIHSNGADWDVLLMKPSSDYNATPEQEAAMAVKRKALGLPSGSAYFIAIRELIAAHTDTKTIGPVSAADWLAKLDASRAEQGEVPRSR
jgi:hypothetical protein